MAHELRGYVPYAVELYEQYNLYTLQQFATRDVNYWKLSVSRVSCLSISVPMQSKEFYIMLKICAMII